MVHDYKSVNIYADPQDTLFLIPNGESSDGLTMGLDIIHELKPPYTEEELENALLESMDLCYSEFPSEQPNSIIVRHLGLKSYSKATKDKRYVMFKWTSDEGYTVTPSIKKRGYEHLTEQSIFLGKSFKNGELANAVKKALALSSC
jgi:hypothetical protein